MLILVVGTAAAPPKDAKRLVVPRIAIVDDAGRVRISIGMEGDSPAIRLYDATGTRRAEFLLRDDGVPFLTLRDHEGKSTAQLDVAPGGSGGLSLQGGRRGYGAPRREIAAGFSFPGSQPFIRLTGRDDKVIWRAP